MLLPPPLVLPVPLVPVPTCRSLSLPLHLLCCLLALLMQSPTSLQWFLDVYPHLSAEHRPLEVVQHPGETIFLPGGGRLLLSLFFLCLIKHHRPACHQLDAAVLPLFTLLS